MSPAVLRPAFYFSLCYLFVHKQLLSAITCEEPSLQSNFFHIVIGGHKGIGNHTEHESDTHINIQYLFHYGLTNARVFLYKRLNPEKPILKHQHPCGVTVEEKLLLPNEGRDGAAFFDYLIDSYDNPPKAIVYMHGHAAIGEHLTCNSAYSRMLKYYQDLQHNISFSRMITLTEPPKYINGSNPYNWRGGRSRQLEELENESPPNKCTDMCLEVYNRYNITAYASGTRPWKNVGSGIQFRPSAPDKHPDEGKDNYMRSCCASFILPGYKIRMYPIAFYYDILRVLQTDLPIMDCLPMGSRQQMGWQCFEFMIWDLFADVYGVDTDVETEKKWYEDAYELRKERKDNVGLKLCKQLERKIHTDENRNNNMPLSDNLD